jgi:hypothetical protein
MSPSQADRVGGAASLALRIFADVQTTLNQAGEIGQREWFKQDSVGSRVHQPVLVVPRNHPRDNDQRHPAKDWIFTHLHQSLQTIHDGHVKIGKDQGGRVITRLAQSFFAMLSFLNAEAEILQSKTE